MPTMNCLLFPKILTLQTQSVSTCTLFIITVVLVIFATQVKKRRAEIKICAFFFLAFLWSDYHRWEAIVLFIQSCKLPTNWIDGFLP